MTAESRNVLGTKSLKEILSDRETIARDMQCLLYEATEPWGVQVQSGTLALQRSQIQLEDHDVADASFLMP